MQVNSKHQVCVLLLAPRGRNELLSQRKAIVLAYFLPHFISSFQSLKEVQHARIPLLTLEIMLWHGRNPQLLHLRLCKMNTFSKWRWENTSLRRYLHTTWYCCSVVYVLELKWGETYIAPHQMDWLAQAWVIRYPWASTNCKHASWPGEYGHMASTNSVTPVEQTLQSLVNTSLGLPSSVLMFNILCLLIIIIEMMH